MREAFREWLRRRYPNSNTQATQLTQARRIEGQYGDLDQAYDADRFAALRQSLAYSKDDERAGRPNLSRIEINGDIYQNLASYRATLGFYTRFREWEAGAVQMDKALLERLKALFLNRCKGFESFEQQDGRYWRDERKYKNDVIAAAQEILSDTAASDEALGLAFLELMRRPPANFINWRAFKIIDDSGIDGKAVIARALGEMLRDDDDPASIASKSAAVIHSVLSAEAGRVTFAHERSLATTALALARPDEAFPVKTRYLQRLAKDLTGKSLFKNEVMSAAEYAGVLAFADSILAIMRDEWKWAPRDLWDVQGFFWMVGDQDGPNGDEEDEEDEGPGMTSAKPSSSAQRPSNTILYGPPGTGKTYATARKAVELCDGTLPDGGRAALMERYRELVARRRISFVTFHQSYAYEDFVEGLRPETNGDEDETKVGFSLRPQPGVFRQIAELARDNKGRSAAPAALDRTKQVFKMSLGRSQQEEGARLFREAINGGYVLLGWGGEIDWSAPEYASFEAIKRRWQQDNPGATGNDPNVSQLYTLRGAMREGDYVIISDGNKKFRAVGVVTGPYYFELGALREYNHRRPVRWLWHSTEGQPRELIYRRGFSQVSAYQLDSDEIDWPALEQVVAGSAQAATGEPEPYVLVIDEINRANVSKVFGELITLIEPDKRLDQVNALTVTLPYSGESFGVPANLHILGTMNTADRSIALLDTALRRRFEFVELMPEPELLADVSARSGVNLVKALDRMNRRIEYLFDREHQVGHAFFMDCTTREDVDHVMRTKVIPLLSEYFYENWEKVRAVLAETGDEGAFVRRSMLSAPRSDDDSGFGDEPRWRYEVRKQFSEDAYRQLAS